MTDAYKNFAYSTVATAPSPASSGTSLVVFAGDGGKFPAPPFNAVIWPAGAQPVVTNAEIVRVTAVATDTFTITRTQESTSARTVVVGDQISAAFTAKLVTDLSVPLEYPWLIDIDPLPTAIAQTNWDTLSHDTLSTYAGYKTSSGAQNAEINWDVLLAAGTWTVELIYVKSSTAGIISVQFDAVEKGTVDSYNASTVYDNRASITGVVIAATAKVRLKLKMATKNASSSSYIGFIAHVQLRRTA